MEKEKKKVDTSKYYPLFFTIIFVIILFQYSFPTLEAIFYDLRVRFDFGIKFKDEIVVITLDEESDEFLGEMYPYTYAGHNKMIEKLLKDEPRVINFMVNLLEPGTEREKEDLDKFKNQIKKFIEDKKGHFRFGTDMDEWGVQLPPKSLRELGHSLSLINIDNIAFSKDDVSRRAILNRSGEDTIHLWTANQYRAFKGLEELDVSNIQGSYYLKEADASFTLFRYYTSPLESNGRIKTIPFHRVVVGNFPKGFFKDRIVLLGSNYISNPDDFVLTPFDKEEKKAPKLFVHAAIIQSLIQNKSIYSLSRTLSYILSVILAIFLSLTISKVRPTHGLLITVVMMLSVLLISYALFCVFGYWLYVTHLVLTVFVVYYIWVPFRAIGEYQRRYAIQEEAKLIETVENLKQNFISLMSHDLKTPVAKIAGVADNMLKQEADSTVFKKNLHFIIDSTKELNRFITSILDLTKIESRNLRLNMASKDINPVIESIVEGLRYEVLSNKVTIKVSLEPLYPINFDLNLMKRVLSNLIENAIKYSGAGSEIVIKSWDDENWVYINIEDSGIGIPLDDLEHIFDKFYRVKNDMSHSVKGSGLGLFLVKYFVELHGGTIEAESELGQGTKFKIKLKNE